MAVNKLHKMAALDIAKLRRRHKRTLATTQAKLDEKYITGPNGEESLLNSFSESERGQVLDLALVVEKELEAKQLTLTGVDAGSAEPTVAEDAFAD